MIPTNDYYSAKNRVTYALELYLSSMIEFDLFINNAGEYMTVVTTDSLSIPIDRLQTDVKRRANQQALIDLAKMSYTVLSGASDEIDHALHQIGAVDTKGDSRNTIAGCQGNFQTWLNKELDYLKTTLKKIGETMDGLNAWRRDSIVPVSQLEEIGVYVKLLAYCKKYLDAVYGILANTEIKDHNKVVDDDALW